MNRPKDKTVFAIIMYTVLGFALLYHLQFIYSQMDQYILIIGLIIMIMVMMVAYNHQFIKKGKKIVEVDKNGKCRGSDKTF